MAVVDSLLRLLASQAADALVIPSGEPPSLERGGEPRPLSMPDPGPEFVAMVIAEVASAEERTRLGAGSIIETTHVGGDGVRYGVRIEPRREGPRIVFRTPGSASVDTPAPTLAPPAPTIPRAAPTIAAPAPTIAPPAPTIPRAAVIEPTPAAIVDPGALAPTLQRAVHERASDVIFSSGANTRMRVGGHIVEMAGTACDDAALLAFVAPAMFDHHREELERTGSADLVLAVDEGGQTARYRANLFRQHNGLALALRPIRRRPPTLSELNLPAELAALVQYRSGLVLMTGTAGSGKSTTLVALIEHVNQSAAKHVITIEDPIEYEYTPARSLVHQRQVGMHVDSFSTGLRAALRESPDVILLGEMRDHATIAAALTAAETGHLVLSTLHANGVAMAVDRIIDVFPEHQQAQVRLQLATVLRAIVTQRLLLGTRPPTRVPALELLKINTAVASKIREGRGHQLQSEVQKGRGEGMIPFEASLADLVRRGLLAVETAVEAADDPALMHQILRAR